MPNGPLFPLLEIGKPNAGKSGCLEDGLDLF